MVRAMTGTSIQRGLADVIGYSLGRGVRSIRTLAQQEIVGVSPLKAGIVVGAVWGGIAAVVNVTRYRQNKISKERAIAATARESIGVGVSASLGLLVGNATRLIVVAPLATSTTGIALSAIATAGFKAAWDHMTSGLIDKLDQEVQSDEESSGNLKRDQ